jgi:CRP-like cAMP-binding protein
MTGLALEFDVQNFLKTTGIGRTIVQLKASQTFYSQGDPADSVFYLQHGRADSLLSPAPVKKPLLRSCPQATSLERNQLLR